MQLRPEHLSPVVLKPHENHVIVEPRTGFVRVLDPDTGRFLFEFEPKRDLVVWYERGKRVQVELAKYR